MTDPYHELAARGRDWVERAAAAGWLEETDRRRFAALEHATPADLFPEGTPRPLVVALFGGTGVGKSSLLNRLAGRPIARVGPERPTSRGVTLYVHESVALAELPPELPLGHVQVQRHATPAARDVLWLDAPDIDSTAQSNRQVALAWVPHVDLLCYVVSPERYRDDVGWRVLRERGGRHGWMFIMNRWDEGDPRQREDFAGMLRAAGFENPLLFCTSCGGHGPLPTPDEFDQVEATIRGLCQAHAVRELARLGYRARLQDLRDVLQQLAQRLGDEARWHRLQADFAARWRAAAAQIAEGAGWGMDVLAERFAIREGGVLRRTGERLVHLGGGPAPAAGKTDPPIASPLAGLTDSLWDPWHTGKVAGCLAAVQLAAAEAGLAAEPLRRAFQGLADRAGPQMVQAVSDHVRTALARPGNALRRVGRRVTGFLMTALPAAALAAIGYWVIIGYYAAVRGRQPFLGSQFAIHSGLLVLVAWLLPYLLDRLLRPSLERTVRSALQAGFGAGLAELEAQIEQRLSGAAEEARAFRTELEELQKTAAALVVRPLDVRHEALVRLVAR